MENLRETLYFFVPILWCLGSMLGLICLAIQQKDSLIFKSTRLIFLACLPICWILLLLLFLTLPEFNWVNAILQPPLLLISALSFWQLVGGFGKVSIKSKARVPVIFAICIGSLILLLGLQFFNIYGTTLLKTAIE